MRFLILFMQANTYACLRIPRGFEEKMKTDGTSNGQRPLKIHSLPDDLQSNDSSYSYRLETSIRQEIFVAAEQKTTQTRLYH